MTKPRGKLDPGFKEGAVRLVGESGQPITQVTRDWESTRGPSACLSGARRTWRTCEEPAGRASTGHKIRLPEVSTVSGKPELCYRASRVSTPTSGQHGSISNYATG